MTDSALITVGLPVALAIIMFGRGLSLTVDDFRGVARVPRAVIVALALQILVLPLAFGAILGERDDLGEYVRQVGIVTTLFCLASLTIGYLGAKALRLTERQAIASSMEVGIHNTTVALTIALSVLASTEVAIPSAVYSIVMYIVAAAFGMLITRRRPDRELAQPAG